MDRNSEEEEEGPDEGPPNTSGPPDERILAPDELDITDDEKVEEIDDGKFVIGTEGKPKVPPEERSSGTEGADTGTHAREGSPETGTAQPSGSDRPAQGSERQEDTFDRRPGAGNEQSSQELQASEVRRFVSDELRRTDGHYAYRIAAKTGNSISHHQLASDDIGIAFDGLLMWYAQQVSSNTTVEVALGLLLAKSNIRIRYPTKLLTAYLQQHDLSPDDDIGDLLEVIRSQEGLVFPPGARR